MIVVKCPRCGRWRGTIAWSKTSKCGYCGKEVKHDDHRVIKKKLDNNETMTSAVARMNEEEG